MARNLFPGDEEPPAPGGPGYFGPVERPTFHPAGAPEESPRSTDWLRSGAVRLLVVLVVIIGCAGAVWVAYERAHQVSSPSGEVPLIRADQTPMKTKPDSPGGVQEEGEAPAVYNAAGTGTVEKLLPSAEEPMARPAPAANEPVVPPLPPVGTVPPPQTVATAPPPVAAAPEAAPVPAVQAEPEPQEPEQAAAAVPPPVAMPAPKPVRKPAPPPASAKSAGDAGPYRVQIAATKNEAGANAEWKKLQKAHGDLLGGLDATVVRADLGSRGIFYRVQAGPVADKAQAQKLCGALKQLSIGCILVKP